MNSKQAIRFLFACLALSWTLQAMEEPEAAKIDVEKERKAIVMGMFPSLVYKDTSDDTSVEIPEGSLGAQTFSGIFCVPLDVNLQIFYQLSPHQFLVGLGGSCKYFQHYTHAPMFCLSPCLQETISGMPVQRLVYRTRNTQNGILKLANLYSVSCENLLTWFGQTDLETALKTCEAIPESLEGLTENQIDALYPVIKVKLGSSTEELPLLRLSSDQIVYDFPCAQLRLVTLCSNKNNNGDGVAAMASYFLWERLSNKEKERSLTSMMVLRALLLDNVLFGFASICYQNIIPKEDWGKLIRWYSKNQFLTIGASHIVKCIAETLEAPELALEIASQVMKMPTTPLCIPQKIGAFNLYASDPRFQEDMKTFAQELYDQHWATLNHEKNAAMVLLLNADHEAFHPEFSNFLTNPNNLRCNTFDNLHDALLKRGCIDEANQLIKLVLADTESQNLPPFCSLPYFLEHAAKVDREALIIKVKSFLSFKQRNWKAGNLALIRSLAQYAGEEIPYIMEEAQELHKEWSVTDYNSVNPDANVGAYEGEFALLYFYLGEKDLCGLHYQKWIDWFSVANKNEPIEVFEKLQKAGVYITSLGDLRLQDPFEIFPILIKE